MKAETKSIIDLATQGLKFLAPNANSEQRQVRKNIRLAFRNYKRICKEIEKNGVTPEEQVMLETLLKQIAESQSKLI